MSITVETFKWSRSQEIFLLTHYQFMGDVEISELMNIRFPRHVTLSGVEGCFPWTRKHVAKKRARMELYRTPGQLLAIRARNTSQGRYNTEPARDAYKKERDQVTDKYIISNCLRHPIAKHEKIRKDHGLLIELTRRSIIQKRAERINYAVQ